MEKLNEDFIINLSNNKGEPLWMKNFRLNSYKKFLELDNPSFGPKINIDFDNLVYHKGLFAPPSCSWENVDKKVILPILGLNMAMYSRRTLLKFYSDTFKTEYTDVAILKNDAVEFLAKENEYGTVLFYNKYFNLIPELEHINDDKILMYYIDPNGLTSKDVIAILKGKKIDYDNKFYENKTVYKVGDLK